MVEDCGLLFLTSSEDDRENEFLNQAILCHPTEMGSELALTECNPGVILLHRSSSGFLPLGLAWPLLCSPGRKVQDVLRRSDARIEGGKR